MSHMFENAKSFNQNLNSWNTNNLQNDLHMFTQALSFDNENAHHWYANIVQTYDNDLLMEITTR